MKKVFRKYRKECRTDWAGLPWKVNLPSSGKSRTEAFTIECLFCLCTYSLRLSSLKN